MDISDIAASLKSSSYAFVPRKDMLTLMTKNNAIDIQKFSKQFHQAWNQTTPQRSTENNAEIYPYKGTLVSYHTIPTPPPTSTVSQRITTNLQNHTELGKCTFEEVDNTTSTTGNAAATYGRLHRCWPDSVDTNPIQHALHNMISELLTQPNEIGIDVDEIENIPWECMQTAFRVTKSNQKHGEPGPEGIHQDACQLTIIILMNRTNVQLGSGGNRVWSLNQKNGKPTEEDIASHRLLQEIVLTEQFDALFVLDRKVKHEALPIELERRENEEDVAVRDVLTFEVRLPKILK